MNRFSDKVVLVTGASSGIGKAACRLFAAQGAKVIALARREREGEIVADEIRKTGGEAEFVRADVSSARDCQAAVEFAERRFGGLDIAFNNAGIGSSGKFVPDLDEETWDRILAINLKGVFLGMKYQIPAMLRRGGGAIINTSSVGGLIAAPGMSAYQASKHAVLGLTKAAALEYVQQNIRINAICPAATHSEMLDRWFLQPGVAERVKAASPIGRVASADEVARTVLFLASGDASYIVGHSLVVDGGVVIH